MREAHRARLEARRAPGGSKAGSHSMGAVLFWAFGILVVLTAVLVTCFGLYYWSVLEKEGWEGFHYPFEEFPDESYVDLPCNWAFHHQLTRALRGRLIPYSPPESTGSRHCRSITIGCRECDRETIEELRDLMLFDLRREQSRIACKG